MKQANPQQLFLLDTEKTYQQQLPFFMQAIVGADDELVFGFEILYRGGAPRDWAQIDSAVLRHLCATPPGSLPTLFVNICNQAFLDIDPDSFIQAARLHTIYFEMSETQADAAMLAGVAAKMRSLASQGVLFAHDDYGSAKDGLPRVFALDCISMIKIDGALIKQAMQSRHAADALRSLLSHWRDAGIASIAECIETPLMLEFARALRVDFVQGFHVDALLNGLNRQDLSDAV